MDWMVYCGWEEKWGLKLTLAKVEVEVGAELGIIKEGISVHVKSTKSVVSTGTGNSLKIL